MSKKEDKQSDIDPFCGQPTSPAGREQLDAKRVRSEPRIIDASRGELKREIKREIFWWNLLFLLIGIAIGYFLLK